MAVESLTVIAPRGKQSNELLEAVRLCEVGFTPPMLAIFYEYGSYDHNSRRTRRIGEKYTVIASRATARLCAP